ncbi:DDE-type integrase/transposase/recombinase, partial [Turicimonas muris]
MYLEHEGFCVPLQRTIKEKFNQDINIRMLERFCKCFRKAIRSTVSPEDRTVRFETEPGDQLQIDFGEKVLIIAGEQTKVYFFVCKLGYSRKIFVKAYLNKKEQAWLDGLESAFYYFGGLPVTIVSDNDTALL